MAQSLCPVKGEHDPETLAPVQPIYNTDWSGEVRICMHRRFIYLGVAILMCRWLGFAQQGHPLTGTWNGDWGTDTVHRNQVTLIMNWDGKNVSGQINPGPDAIRITTVQVDVTNWNVRIDADAKDKSGKTEHITAEGHLDDLGSYHRTITGTWHQGATIGN